MIHILKKQDTASTCIHCRGFKMSRVIYKYQAIIINSNLVAVVHLILIIIITTKPEQYKQN